MDKIIILIIIHPTSEFYTNLILSIFWAVPQHIKSTYQLSILAVQA